VPAATRLLSLVGPAFSGDTARAVVELMEHYWRLPGNAGFNASIDRVAGTLRRAGYLAQDSAPPGSRLTYRIERRPMARSTWEPEDASLAIVGGSAPLLRWATNRNMMAINSYSTDASGVEGELISVGKGTPDEFARATVAGKIVFGELPVGRLFEEAVRKRGAVGVLAYSLPAYTQPETHRSSIQFSNIPLDSAKHSWGLLLSYDARQALQAALAKGTVRVRVMTRARSFSAEERTLIAEVHGAPAPNERFVFSAHVQEPGANDNASGVGTQAEMARVAAQLVRAGQVAPKRTITFIWGDEIRASQRYLQENPERTRGVRWGLSLDMVGEDTKLTGGTFLIEKMPDPSAVWTRGNDRHTEWGGGELTEDKLTPHFFNDFVLNRCLEQAAKTGWVVRTNPFEGGSDHVPFLEAKKPGLLFWHFTDVYYHTDGDRLPNVSAKEMANAGTAALVVALTLVSADGSTARDIVAELERAAVGRLDAERALSSAAVASGGDRTKEVHILRVWTDWYRAAIRSIDEVEVGGSSPETKLAIAAAERRVGEAGDTRIAALGR
jgi:aminopeptidase YwaD